MFIKKFILAFTCLFLVQIAKAESLTVDAIVKDWRFPQINSVSTVLPRQTVKEITASPYIFVNENDFNRDGIKEQVVGANCVEGFCINFIFRNLKNKRYQYLGYAVFHHNYYELVWREENNMPDILYFEQTNVGQGCLGRYQYEKKQGYNRVAEVCRLPKEVMSVVSSYAKAQKEELPIGPERRSEKNLDYIDMSDINFDDSPDDFFPETK